MKKVYIAIVNTEDCESYKMAYSYNPSEKEVKKDFFAKYGNIGYEKSDWNSCIGFEVFELEVKDK